MPTGKTVSQHQGPHGWPDWFWEGSKAAGLVALTLLVYIPAMHAGFIWDDDAYVLNNQTLRSIDGLRQIWFHVGATPQYYPLVFTSYWLEQQLWGLDPTGYHVVNILLHGLCAVLVWRVLKLLQVRGAWIVAAIFALHPVHVESVAWITERKNTLAGVFYLSAALMYFRYALGSNNRQGSVKLYALSLVFYLCALLSKTVTASLPAALLIVLWWKRNRVLWADVRSLAPFFILGIGLGLVTVSMEKYDVGAAGDEWKLSFTDRCLIAGRALWFYAAKLLWPSQLTFNYPRWEIDSGAWGQYLYPVSAIAVVGALWMARRRLGRGPIVAVLFFAGTLFPALGFFDVYPMRYSFVADHFQYLASLGLITLVISVAYLIVDRLGQAGKGIPTIAAALVLVTLGTLTWKQGYIYKDNETLYQDTLQKNPKSRLALTNFGTILAENGKFSEAISYYRQALQNWPNDYNAHRNLAHVLTKQGRFDEAIEHYRYILSIRAFDADAHNRIGYVLMLQGKLDEAIEHYRQHLKNWPLDPDAHTNLGNILMRQGKFREALSHYREALKINPHLAAAHNNLGWALMKTGRLDEGLKHFREAIRLDDDYPPALTGMALILATHPDANVHNGGKALGFVERAMAVTKTPNPLVLEALAAAYAALGRFNDAVKTAQMALELASKVRDDQLSDLLRKQIELYRSGKPYRVSLHKPDT